MKKIAYIGIALLLCACTQKDSRMPSSDDMKSVRMNLAFTCTREADRLPQISADSDLLFKYGRYLESIDGPKDFDDVARYYRIAAANGHYKANHNLQLLVSEGLAASPNRTQETIDLVEHLIADNIPGGYYDMGHYLELGYGVKRDLEKARRYFRKAADLGSPEAQYYVGDLLSPPDNAPDIARQMLQCAMGQGYGKAASYMGIDLLTDKRYAEAVKAFQSGVEAGDSQSASFLENGFKGPPPSSRLYYLALSSDPERSRRYELIRKFITAHESHNPKVPDIDKIVPLPPANLPPWDGTFQWQKERDAAAPPPKPSDELIERMSKAKHLDPATGLPLSDATKKAKQPGSPTQTSTSSSARLPIGTAAYSGDVCPQDGIWRANAGAQQTEAAHRRFAKGDTFPSLTVDEPRQLALVDRWLGSRQRVANVVWQLTAYTDEA